MTAWRKYLERVYHQPIANAVVDLNEFSWFYTDAPTTQLHCFHACEADIDTMTEDGTPWFGPASFPEGLFGRFGYFVRRPFPHASYFENCVRLEVGHVAWDQGWSVGITWFYHTIGSGVFVDCRQLPVEGRVGVFENRVAFARAMGFSHYDHGMGEQTTDLMIRHGYKMIVFLRADWSYKTRRKGENPRTEIAIRNSQPHELTRSACLTETAFQVFTGIHGTLPCDCSPYKAYLNCDRTAHGSGIPAPPLPPAIPITRSPPPPPLPPPHAPPPAPMTPPMQPPLSSPSPPAAPAATPPPPAPAPVPTPMQPRPLQPASLRPSAPHARPTAVATTPELPGASLTQLVTEAPLIGVKATASVLLLSVGASVLWLWCRRRHGHVGHHMDMEHRDRTKARRQTAKQRLRKPTCKGGRGSSCYSALSVEDAGDHVLESGAPDSSALEECEPDPHGLDFFGDPAVDSAPMAPLSPQEEAALLARVAELLKPGA